VTGKDVGKLESLPTKKQLIGKIASSIKQITTKIPIGIKQITCKVAYGARVRVGLGATAGGKMQSLSDAVARFAVVVPYAHMRACPRPLNFRRSPSFRNSPMGRVSSPRHKSSSLRRH
jgi:hypothetical protein